MTETSEPAPDPGNSPPEAWTGDPVDPAVEERMIAQALAADVRGAPYETEGWRDEYGQDSAEVPDGV